MSGQEVIRALAGGQQVRFDANGLVSLTDLHRLSGAADSQRPAAWGRLPAIQRIISALLDKIVGKSHNFKESYVKSILYAKGRSGTFAHPVLALGYAEYLSPELAVEVRELFLRYKANDPALADEILQKASPEANEWAGVRALTRSQRRQYTDVLKNHGVHAWGFGVATDGIYFELFDGGAKALKEKRGIASSKNLRDTMEVGELSLVMAAEHLASERIRDEECEGNPECITASRRSASFIRQAVEADRADRKRRTPS